MARILLVGFMGCGKSAVGRVLAHRLETRFIDLDCLIEEAQELSIPEIFTTRGEAGFREAEHHALEQVTSEHEGVVAGGGGLFAQERNRAVIEASGFRSVFLDVPWTILAARLLGEEVADRPMYHDPEQAHELYRQRLDDYRSADLVLPIREGETVTEIVDRLVDRLREALCVT